MFPERAAALLVPSLLFLTGCPRLPVNFGPQGEAHTAREVLKRVELAESSVISIKGDARLGIDAPSGKGSVTLFVAVAHPNLMHLEQLDFFGRPQGVLVTNGERFGLYDAQAGKYFRGPATATNLGRFLPVVMPPGELVALLLGRVPRVDTDELKLRFDDQRGGYEVTLTKGPITQTVVVKPPEDRVVKSSVVGLNAYDLDLGEVTALGGGGSFAKRVQLTFAHAKTSVELTWKEFEVNQPADLSMFELEAPEGVPVVEVDAQGRPVGG